jgi:putative addiction module component (TIGR02574 family)
MPELCSYLFRLILTVFFILGALNLNVKQIIAFVTLVKKLKATLGGRFSLSTGKIEPALRWRKCLSNPARFCYSHGMSSNLDQLTADAMKLPLRDRVQLAQRLVSTLEDEIEADTEALWFAEVERRLDELRSGKVQGIPAEDVFRNAREALKR